MTHSNLSSVVLIPAFNPDSELLGLVSELRNSGYEKIVVVNDGSDSKTIFSDLERDDIVVLHHPKNLGKGAALKTGFRYCLDHYSGTSQGIITVDADGQHLVEDVRSVDAEFCDHPDHIVLGVRIFDKGAPLRSAFGNRITSFVLGEAENIKLSDTQTGLRAIPLEFAERATGIRGDHYEFELECLVLAKRLQLEISEVPITTVYHGNNESSHFRPLIDSLRVYSVFSRFLVMSLASFIVDICLFLLVFLFTNNVYLSTYVSRSASASINFLGNKFIVFKSHSLGSMFGEALSYVCLVFVVATLSAFLVEHLYIGDGPSVLFVKIGVDAALFFLNFLVQKHLLFKFPKEA